MSKIMIGDCIINTEDIVEVSEKEISFSIKKYKPNPNPKPEKGFLKKLFYSNEITYYETEKYPCWVLKVFNGTQTVLPDNSDTDTIYIGSASYGTHKTYRFYTIYNDVKFLKNCKDLYGELKDDLLGDEARSKIIQKLCEIGMLRTLYGWQYPDHLDTCMQLDTSIKCKADVISKYLK